MKNIDFETGQQTRTENLMIRVTPQEKVAFRIEAQKAGVSISAFIRLMMHNYSNGITFSKKG